MIKKITLITIALVLMSKLVFAQFIEMTPVGAKMERDSSASFLIKSRLGSYANTLTKLTLDATYAGILNGQARSEINFDLAGENAFKIVNSAGQTGSFPFSSFYSHLIFYKGNNEMGRFSQDFFRVGKLGIGADPWHPLSFSPAYGDKISLSGVSLNCVLNTCVTDSTHFGFGYQPDKLQIITKNSSGDVVLGYGKSNSLTENVRFKGNGRVGIGISNPANLLDINGRVRIRNTAETAGIWLGNSLNGLSIDDGAFVGMQTSTAGSEKAGIWIASDWRFYVDRAGIATMKGGMNVGGGDNITKIRKQTVNFDLQSVPANSSNLEYFNLGSLSPEDVISVNPTATIFPLVIASVRYTSVNLAEVVFYNPSSNAVDKSAMNFNFLIVR